MTGQDQKDAKRIAVVIPCYRSAATVGELITRIGPEVDRIYCVNDASDDNLSEVLAAVAQSDARVTNLTHAVNGGVGAATVTGYRAAIEGGAQIIVKLDSDGQMDPRLILAVVAPIRRGEADYVKGNRFFDIESVREMPKLRLIGNAGLSFMSKLSSGHWHLFDPNNGFTAIHADVASVLPLEKLHKRYFFESDLLFRLGTVKAAVRDVPMEAIYGDETSNLSEMQVLFQFPLFHARNFFKRIAYNYFLRDFSAASLSLIVGVMLLVFGVIFGISAWVDGARAGVPATAGTVMLSAFPTLVGIQLLLSFLGHDVSMSPRKPIHLDLAAVRVLSGVKLPADKVSVRETSSG